MQSKSFRQPGMSARSLIANSGVTLVCTTDDPADSLEWHQQLAQEQQLPGESAARLASRQPPWAWSAPSTWITSSAWARPPAWKSAPTQI